MPDKPKWYEAYPQRRAAALQRKQDFETRCAQLGISPVDAQAAVTLDILTRVVHESNWNEDLYLDEQSTRELAEVALDSTPIVGPHLDIQTILSDHAAHVETLKRAGRSTEELGAYNLSMAHLALQWIRAEALSQALAAVRERRKKLSEGPLSAADTFQAREAQTQGQRSDEDFEETALDPDQFYPLLKIEYLHFLHQLVLMGIAPDEKRGRFRPSSVMVGDPALLFPAPSFVPALMQEFCAQFPIGVPSSKQRDLILAAAQFSHRFVRIHPYADGNGRVSRLLMNLILAPEHPPVYIKADTAGRKRYGYALRRANCGNIEPLACLIATALKEVYDMVIASISPPETNLASQIALNESAAEGE